MNVFDICLRSDHFQLLRPSAFKSSMNSGPGSLSACDNPESVQNNFSEIRNKRQKTGHFEIKTPKSFLNNNISDGQKNKHMPKDETDSDKIPGRMQTNSATPASDS